MFPRSTFNNLEMGEKQPLNGTSKDIIKIWRMAFRNLHSVLISDLWQMTNGYHK